MMIVSGDTVPFDYTFLQNESNWCRHLARSPTIIISNHHALNKMTKDFVLKYWTLIGQRSDSGVGYNFLPYVKNI